MKLLIVEEVTGWMILLLILLVVVYSYFSWQPNVWRSQGVPGPASYPFVGTNLDMFTKGQREMERERYMKYHRLWGAIEAKQPVLVVGDEEMLRQIMVKDFATFSNRRPLRLYDDLASHMLTFLTDDTWKRVRTLLTPSFSTGKLKLMLQSVSECCELLAENLGSACDAQQDFECKRLFGAYTLDVIARTAFGIEMNSQKDRDNKFVQMSKRAFDFNLFRPMFLILMVAPWMLPVCNWFGLTVFDKEVITFFKSFLTQVIEERKEEQVHHKDFLQLMLNAHKDEVDAEAVDAEEKEMGGEYDRSNATLKKGLTRNEVLGQGFLFFVAGYETTATTLSMLIYSLAIFPEIQEKLYDEIIREYGTEGDLDYESFKKSSYLSMCIDETLRMYPPSGRVDRYCCRDTQLNGISIRRGSLIAIPIIGIHYDPKIYPDPERFCPERFSPEKKAERSPFHFLPFGYGPRNCIGMRLAQMEIMIATIYVLRRYKFFTCEKTEYPLKLKKFTLFGAVNGIWLRAERRENAPKKWEKAQH